MIFATNDGREIRSVVGASTYLSAFSYTTASLATGLTAAGTCDKALRIAENYVGSG